MSDDVERIPRVRARWSIQLRLGVLLGAVAALAVIALAGLDAILEVAELRQSVAERNLELARHLAEDVEDRVLTIQRELSMLAADPRFAADLTNADVVTMTHRLEAVAATEPNLTALAVFDEERRLWANSLADKSYVGTNYGAGQLLQDVFLTGRPSFGAPTLAPISRVPIIPFAVPVRTAENRTVGVLVGTLSLQRLSDHLNALRVGESGLVTLVGKAGKILTHPDSSRILAELEDDDQLVAEAREGRRASAEMVDTAGTRVFAAAAPVRTLGWVVQLQIPVDEAFAPLRAELVRAIWTALVAFLVATLVGTIFARRLTAPILQLRRATHRVARGEFGNALPPVRSGDELEELANDFELMTARLRESVTALEARAEKETRLKSEMVSLVSHELRTPLTSIRGYAELLLDRETGELNEEQAGFVQTIHRNTTRLAKLVNDWLDLASLEAGKAPAERAPVDLAEVIDQTVATLQLQIMTKGQQIDVEQDANATAFGDRTSLLQVATNLLSNAHKYTAPGGRLHLRATDDGPEWVCLEVIDTGIGLSEEEQTKLFTKFFRARHDTAERGTGLGLALSKHLVEQMGGEIRVRSAVGIGSTFTVRLPRASGPRSVSTTAA